MPCSLLQHTKLLHYYSMIVGKYLVQKKSVAIPDDFSECLFLYQMNKKRKSLCILRTRKKLRVVVFLLRAQLVALPDISIDSITPCARPRHCFDLSTVLDLSVVQTTLCWWNYPFLIFFSRTYMTWQDLSLLLSALLVTGIYHIINANVLLAHMVDSEK